MPFRCADYQSRFAWHLADDLPVCDVILLGGVPYTASCPLCGCLHELPAESAHNGAIISPRCLLREFAAGQYAKGSTTAWQTMYSDWLARFPDAANHQQIMVKLTSIAELMARPAVKLVAKKRKTAAPKAPAAIKKAKTSSPRKAAA